MQRDYEQWVTALGELLRPNLIVDMTKFKDMDVDKRFFLWGSMAHKERLVTKEGFSDIGLKVIDFADLRKQLHDIEKAQRKSSKDVHKEKPRSPERNNGVET